MIEAPFPPYLISQPPLPRFDGAFADLSFHILVAEWESRWRCLRLEGHQSGTLKLFTLFTCCRFPLTALVSVSYRLDEVFAELPVHFLFFGLGNRLRCPRSEGHQFGTLKLFTSFCHFPLPNKDIESLVVARL